MTTSIGTRMICFASSRRGSLEILAHNRAYRGDFVAALKEIEAKGIVIACDNDLYLRPKDNQIEIERIRNGELRIYSFP